jgi:hypothetical protein
MPGSHQQLIRTFWVRLSPLFLVGAFSLAAGLGVAAWP